MRKWFIVYVVTLDARWDYIWFYVIKWPFVRTLFMRRSPFKKMSRLGESSPWEYTGHSWTGMTSHWFGTRQQRAPEQFQLHLCPSSSRPQSSLCSSSRWQRGPIKSAFGSEDKDQEGTYEQSRQKRRYTDTKVTAESYLKHLRAVRTPHRKEGFCMHD